MLALAQLSSIPAVLKRRNSRVGKPSSPSHQSSSASSLSLASNIRRFSSTETLSSKQPAAPSVALVARRSSFSRKLRKGSVATSSSDVNSECMQLDLLFAEIKRKLAEFREEDIEMVDRIDDLVTSVGDLCDDYRIESETTPLSASLVQLVHEYPTESLPESPRRVAYRKRSESSSEDEDDFHQFCHTHGHSLDLTSTRTMPTYRWSASSERPRPSATIDNSNKRWSAAGTIDSSVCVTVKPPVCPTNTSNYQWTHFNMDSHLSRPLSYQEISYEEEDDKNSPSPFLDIDNLASWEDLSCP